MSFSDFLGNPETVHRLREMLARKRFPHAVILSGAQGSGKYTLALMLARAMNCLEQPVTDGLPDFCGRCSNCIRIGQAEDLDARFAEAVEARDGLREADKKETRIFVQTHPDVLVIPPDPPQLMIKVDQVRHVIGSIYFRPAQARERVYVFTDSAFMKEAANSLLKVLEEPPEFATIFLLAENPGELLPTIRSRSVSFALGALSSEQVESLLAELRPDWNPRERALVARLSEGAMGRALSFDLKSYTAARSQALVLLNSALRGSDHSELFKTTESYRAGAEGREKTDNLLRTLYTLLEDLMFLESGTPQLVRNTDIQGELEKMADSADFAWIQRAAEGLGEVERGMRRNLLRSLSLDAFATALERTS
ncbi:MAG: DNA polymerase III subunit delta' [Acidobacteriales bacterium]|nr:DNA polymerase III subunit delta' [Candidatus Koribacter versatilis]MBI3646656.1 DNA polymerase III subunit delta' [Terriglobales bacterium]